MEFKWTDGFMISVREEDGAVVIAANRAGLQSLADHLLRLAEQDGQNHFHLDQYNSLEEGSLELIIEKTE